MVFVYQEKFSTNNCVDQIKRERAIRVALIDVIMKRY